MIERIKPYIGGTIHLDSTHNTTRSEPLHPPEHDPPAATDSDIEPEAEPEAEPEPGRKRARFRDERDDHTRIDRQLYSLVVADGSSAGVVLSSFYIDRNDAVSLARCLQCIKEYLSSVDIDWHPLEVTVCHPIHVLQRHVLACSKLISLVVFLSS